MTPQAILTLGICGGIVGTVAVVWLLAWALVRFTDLGRWPE